MDCAICCEQIAHNSISSTTLSCKHTFHIRCISEWLGINPSCPNCRKCLAPLEVYYASIEIRLEIPRPPPPIHVLRDEKIASPPRIHRVRDTNE